MKISVYISLFIILFISPFLPADTVTQTWTASYNSPMNLDDILADIAVDNSGNVYVTGTSLVGSTSNIVTIKYNSAGVQQWVRSYDSGLSANDYAAAIAADGSGNVYVAGRSDTATSGLTACTTLKYNSSGTLQWAKSFQGTASTGTNQLSDILVEPSGNVYVVGSAAQNTTNSDYVIIKYSPAGDEVWNKTYNSSGSESDYAISMVRDSAGGIYAAGNRGTVKYNSSGTQQWAVEQSNNCCGLAIDSSSNIYILYPTSSSFDVVKYNSAGTKQWTAPYPNPAGTTANPSAIAVDASGNSYVTGVLPSMPDGGLFIAKFDAYGFFVWDAMYNMISAPFYPGSIACDQWTGIYATATINNDLFTFKFDSDGNEKWIMLYPANQNYEFPTPIAVKSGEVYVATSAYSPTTHMNYATVKYEQSFCKKFNPGDINGDCRVDFKDLAEMATYWAECNLYPASDCQ